MTEVGHATVTCPVCRINLTVPIYARAPLHTDGSLADYNIYLDLDHDILHDHATHCPGNN